MKINNTISFTLATIFLLLSNILLSSTQISEAELVEESQYSLVNSLFICKMLLDVKIN